MTLCRCVHSESISMATVAKLRAERQSVAHCMCTQKHACRVPAMPQDSSWVGHQLQDSLDSRGVAYGYSPSKGLPPASRPSDTDLIQSAGRHVYMSTNCPRGGCSGRDRRCIWAAGNVDRRTMTWPVCCKEPMLLIWKCLPALHVALWLSQWPKKAAERC